MLEAVFWTTEEVAAAGRTLYEERIKAVVELPENIGKFLTIDTETGEYSMSNDMMETLLPLHQKSPISRLFTLRIGYQSAVCFGGLSGQIK